MTRKVPAEAVSPHGGIGHGADGACADSVEWLLAEMLRDSTVAGEELPQRLKREGFWEALGSQALAVKSAAGTKREDLLKQMMREVRKFSVGLCTRLLGETRRAAAEAAAAGKDVTVVVGLTGAGKTTFMHVLKGSKFKADQTCGHLRLVGAADGLDGLSVGSDQGRSETRFVRLVEVDGQLFADTPGFQDTNGVEVEVANVLGVCEFLQACSSVRLVVLVSGEVDVSRGQVLRQLADMLGSLLRDPKTAMRSTTFLYTKVSDTHQGLAKKLRDVHKAAEEDKDNVAVQCILGELKRQAAQPTLILLDSCDVFDDEDLDKVADGQEVMLRPCGGDRYDLAYGEHGTVHRATVSLPHRGDAGFRRLDEKLRGELVAAVAAAGAPPLFLGSCVSVRPLEPACAGRLGQAVKARPAVQEPRDVFGMERGLRTDTTRAVREQAALEVKSIQSCVAHCAGLAGGTDADKADCEATWRTVVWRLERLDAMHELLKDVRVGRELEEARRVVRTNLQQRLDGAVQHVARVAGPDACLTEDDVQQVQRTIDGIAASRAVLGELVPDVAWGVLGEKVQWHLRAYARVAPAALKENRPQHAAEALQQMQLLATAAPAGCASAAEVVDKAMACGQEHFGGLCTAVQLRIKEGALHTTEALRGTCTALSDMRTHHTHLHAVLGLGCLDSTGYAAAVEVLREGLAGLTEACARDAAELAGLQVSDDARQHQQQLVAQLRDRLAVLVEAEVECSQHIEAPVLHAFVRGAQGACASAVATLCGRVERAVKGVGGTAEGITGADTHAMGEDVQLCADAVDVVREVDSSVATETLGCYTEMRACMTETTTHAVGEVRRLAGAAVAPARADDPRAGAEQRDQAAALVLYIEQLQRLLPALSRYSQEGQGLLARVLQACRERVGRELQCLAQEAPPECGSVEELLAYCTRMCGVAAAVVLGRVLPEMGDMLVAAEASHTRCVQQCLACLEAELGVPATGNALQAASADDPDVQRFCDMLQQRQTCGVAAPPPHTLAALLMALSRVCDVRRVLHGATGRAAQRTEAGLRGYIYGGATVQRTYAADVSASLEKNLASIATACQDLDADTQAGISGGDGPQPRLRDYVDAMCTGLARLAEVEAAASEGVYQPDTLRRWQDRLQTQVVDVLRAWLAVDHVHIAEVKAVLPSLMSLDEHTGGAVAALKQDCSDIYLKMLKIDGSVMEAVTNLDAESVLRHLDFLQQSKQGRQNYQRLQRLWANRVEPLRALRLPTSGPDIFERCAEVLRKTRSDAMKVLDHFSDDQAHHLGEAVLQGLRMRKDEHPEGAQLQGLFKNLLLQPHQRAVRYHRFNDAKQLLEQLLQAEETLHGFLPEGLLQDISTARNEHTEALDALQAEYCNWDVADPNSPALRNLPLVLRECSECDVTQAIESKVWGYLQGKRGHCWDDQSLWHLEAHLPHEFLSRCGVDGLKERMLKQAADLYATFSMHITSGAYGSAAEIFRKHPEDCKMRDLLRAGLQVVVQQFNDALDDGNVEAAYRHLCQLGELAHNVPDLGFSTEQVKGKLVSVVLHSLHRVAWSLSRGTDRRQTDVDVLASTLAQPALLELAGEEGAQRVVAIQGQLVEAERELDRVLQDGAADAVARVLDAARATADLRSAFACRGAAGVLQEGVLRKKVADAVAGRALPPLHVNMCDNKRERDQVINTLREGLRFAAEACRLQLPQSEALAGGEVRVQQFVREVAAAASTARESISVSCTGQVVPYVLHLEMLQALSTVGCARDEADRCFEHESQCMSARTQSTADVTWSSDDETTDKAVVAALLGLQLLADIPVCQEKAQQLRDRILKKYRDDRRAYSSPFADLYKRLKLEYTGFGGRVIAARNDLFVAEKISAFDEKINKKALDINDVLGKLGLSQKRRGDLLKMYTRDYAARYHQRVEELLDARFSNPTAFQGIVSACVKNVKEFTSPSIVERIASVFSGDSAESNCFKALAEVFAVWSVHCCEGVTAGRVKKVPLPSQVLAVFEAVMAVWRGEGLLVRILTGEGKSVVLGVLATVLALQGFDVSCVCHLEYLSRRDEDNSSPLFEAFKVNDSVHYGTVKELCERVLSERTGDFRAQVKQTVTNGGALQPTSVSEKRRLLLVDEADVLFSKVFLGTTYNPIARAVKAEFVKLADYVWNSCRQGSGIFSTVSETEEYKQCCTAFGEWAPLVEKAVQELLSAAGRYKYRTDWKVKGGKVVYPHFDTYSSSHIYGYETLFHYYQAHEHGDVTRAAVEAQAYLNVGCTRMHSWRSSRSSSKSWVCRARCHVRSRTSRTC